MKNTLILTNDKGYCECTCKSCIYDGTNTLYVGITVGDVSAPKLEVSVNDSIVETVELQSGVNTVLINKSYYKANYVIKIRYTDSGYEGGYFTLTFPDELEGNMMLVKERDYVYKVQYHRYTGGGITPYSLPVATATTLGGVKIGDGVDFNNGAISISVISSDVIDNICV